VLFQIEEAAASELVMERRQLFIELAGDHVRDTDGRTIDATFSHSDLQSGDGPTDAGLGIQGGRFESWVTVGRREIIINGLDINRVGASELATLPGIGRGLARRILRMREERNGFERFEELGEVEGISESVLANLRSLLDNG
jgi:hypothetical protein